MSKYTERRKIRASIPRKQIVLPGRLGDGLGNIVVSGLANYVYCRIGGRVEKVYNDKVPAQNDLLVDVGRDERGLFKVLSTRTYSPGGAGEQVQAGYAPAKRYEIFAAGGGQDPLWVQKRQIMPLRIGPNSGMSIQIYAGLVYVGGGDYKYIPAQTLSLSSYIPASAGSAALVLITVNTSGVIVATDGVDFVLADVTDENDMLTHIPDPPANTAEVLGAVRVYNGQTEIDEGRTNTDIIDLRGNRSDVAAMDGVYLRLDTTNDPLTGGLSIVGSADEVQLSVKGFTGQTANQFAMYDSTGGGLALMSPAGNWGFGGSPLSTFRFSLTAEPDGSTVQGAISAVINVTPAVSGANETRSLQFTAYKLGTNNHGSILGIRGVTGLRGGSGTLANAYGGLLGLQIAESSAGTITTGYGLDIAAPLRDAGSTTATIGTLYGVRIETQGAAYVTNAYGLYLANQSGAATLNYAIYTNTGLNRFGDQINIVGSADRNQLLVQGNLSAQTNHLAYLYTFDTVNNSARPVLRLESRNSTASTGGAAGFGPALSFYAESATNAAYRQQAQIDATWVTATDASRTAQLRFYAYDTAARLALTMTATGSAATLLAGGVLTTVGRKQAVAEKTANYTVTVTDEVLVYTGATNGTFTLPAATGTGQTYRFANESATAGVTLTIDGNASETIKGNLTQVLYAGEDLIVTDYASGKWA